MIGDFLTRRRWIIPVIAALIVLPVVGWSAFWFYARLRAGTEMTAFTDVGSSAPVALVCGSRSIGGYPFNIAIRCSDPVLTIEGDAGPVTLRLARLTITTRLTDPRDQTIDLEGPLTASDAKDRAQASWGTMVIGVRGDVGVADSLFLRGEALRLTCEGCTAMLRQAAVDSFEILAQRRGDTTDFTFSAALGGVQDAALTALTSRSEAATIGASGIITQFEFPTSLRFVAETERWRREGGQIVVDTASLDQGSLHAEVAGRFALDAAHRPSGQFTFGARNAASLIAAFTGGLNPLLQLGISAALRGIDSATADKGNALSLKLPGVIENGSLSLGPARGIASVPPLY